MSPVKKTRLNTLIIQKMPAFLTLKMKYQKLTFCNKREEHS